MAEERFRRIIKEDDDPDTEFMKTWGLLYHMTSTKVAMTREEIYDGLVSYHKDFPEEGAPMSAAEAAIGVMALELHGYLVRERKIERAEWDTFLAGHWTKDMPKKEGDVPVCTRDGAPAGYVTIYLHPVDGMYRPTKYWGGWWWSEPLPKLSTPPAWGEE